MSGQQTHTVLDEFERAADQMLDGLNLVQTLDDIHCEHVPRTATPHNSTSVRATIDVDMIKDVNIGVGGAYQPMVHVGGGPLVVDEPCIILRAHPHNDHE